MIKYSKKLIKNKDKFYFEILEVEAKDKTCFYVGIFLIIYCHILPPQLYNINADTPNTT